MPIHKKHGFLFHPKALVSSMVSNSLHEARDFSFCEKEKMPGGGHKIRVLALLFGF